MTDKASSPPRRARDDARQTAAEAVSDAAAARPGQNLDESPLAWLARRKDKDGRPMISAEEFQAGERLRGDFWFAHMTPRTTVNWSRLQSGGGGHAGSPDHGAETPDAILAARERVRRALKQTGPDLAGILIDVCCHLKGLEAAEKSGGWPQRSGKVVLQIALRQLARHYGIILERQPQQDRAAKVRHWAARDYRPAINRDRPDEP